MDGWMDRWMDGGWMVDGWMDEWWVDGWMVGYMNIWIFRQKDEWMVRGIDR